MPPRFAIHLDHPSLSFSAAHFIMLASDQIESLHGHDYFVRATISGPLNSEQYVLDFVTAHRCLQEALGPLDHKVLLPAHHGAFHQQITEREIEIHFGDRRWVFPLDNVLLLPMENTTTENIALWIANKFIAVFSEKTRYTSNKQKADRDHSPLNSPEVPHRDSDFDRPRYRLTMELEESPGMKASCQMEMKMESQ